MSLLKLIVKAMISVTYKMVERMSPKHCPASRMAGINS